jgi:hypothetical protein
MKEKQYGQKRVKKKKGNENRADEEKVFLVLFGSRIIESL